MRAGVGGRRNQLESLSSTTMAATTARITTGIWLAAASPRRSTTRMTLDTGNPMTATPAPMPIATPGSTPRPGASVLASTPNAAPIMTAGKAGPPRKAPRHSP